MKALFAIFLLILSLSFAGATESLLTVTPDWRPEANIFDAFRSNAPHFWFWLKKQNSALLSYQGVVVGDPHILNFGDVALAQGGRDYALIDIDDGGGQAPLIGDMVRYAAGNQVSPYRVDMPTLYKAYVAGLQGQSMDVPSVIQDAQEQSDKEFSDRQAKYIDKMTAKRKFSDKAKLVSIAQSPQEVQKLFSDSQSTFESALSGYQILDVGYKTKESGGSQGLPRYWYLIEKNKQLYIIEFKLETDAAPSFYSPQGDPSQRFPAVAGIYRPQAASYGPYKIVQAATAQFLMRARLATFLDFDPEKNTSSQQISDAKQVSIYIAYRLGLWQHQQPGSEALLKALSLGDFSFLVGDYVRTMYQENRSN